MSQLGQNSPSIGCAEVLVGAPPNLRSENFAVEGTAVAPQNHARVRYDVRRAKSALSSGCKSHPGELAPAGSNRSSHGGNDMAEAFG